MNRLKATSKDEQFFTCHISVLGPKPGQELPAPSSDFRLSVTPDGELLATIEMPVPIVDVVAIVGSIKLIVDQWAGPNNDMYARKALSLLGETRCPEPKVRLHFPDGALYSGHVYAAANGEELYGCITGFDLAVHKPNPKLGLYGSVFVADLEMCVASLDVVLDGLDPDVFVVARDDQGASIAICPAAAKETVPAILTPGERVLTPEQNAEWKQWKGAAAGSPFTLPPHFTITQQTVDRLTELAAAAKEKTPK